MTKGIQRSTTEETQVPIVFVHYHYSFFLEFTLRQARLTNPDAPIHFLGDAENNLFDFVQHTFIQDLISDDYKRFSEIYQHNSPNQIEYELFCFRRWFLLRELMHRHQYEIAFMADTDVMLYTPIHTIAKHLIDQNKLAAYNIGADCEWVKSASGHSSFWTRTGIDELCQFLLNLYSHPSYQPLLQSIREDVLLNNHQVGISDMTALYLFYKQHAKAIINLSRCSDLGTFDHNFGVATNFALEEYAVSGNHKKVVSTADGYPLCFNRIQQTSVRMCSLHFQGNTKNFIHRYYRGGNLLGLRLYREGRLQVRNLYYALTNLRKQVRQQLSASEPLANVRKSA